jgi:hypothetical protein
MKRKSILFNIKSNYTLTNQLLREMLTLSRHSFAISRKKYEDKVTNNIIINEWKDLAARIDQILFFIATFVILVSPIFIFKKILFEDINQIEECGCDNY